MPSAPKPKFVELCRQMGLLTKASVAIDGSKFKAVNTRDKNFTKGKVERRRQQLEDSVARYLAQLDTADLQDPSGPWLRRQFISRISSPSLRTRCRSS